MKDKILFWLGSDLTHFCLSYSLQKKFDADYYAIIDITNKPKKFFNDQNLVHFNKKWFFHDHITSSKEPDIEYLSNFEKKYDINLWKLAINERTIYRFYNFYKFTKNEILSILESECRLFEKILNEIKPDFFITKEPTFHHLELFYQMCRKVGCKILILTQPNIGYKCIISQEPSKLDSFNINSDIDEDARSFEELQQYIQSNNISKPIRNYGERHGRSTSSLLKATFDFLVKSSNNNIKTHYNYYGRTKWKVFSYMIIMLLKKKYRKSFIDKNLITQIDYTKPFVYFAMGVDLERNFLINAPYFTNQTEMIRHIAKSLPIGYSLFVKENPSQSTREWRSISEYKEILSIPNVTLIHPSVKAVDLIKNSSLIISITGTSTFEAAFYKKPSIVFADNKYNVLPSIFRIKEIEKLPKIIETALSYDISSSYLDHYMKALEKNWFDFDWFGFGSLLKDVFYYEGNLVDVDISNDKMQNFLTENESKLESLTNAHIEKINHYKSLHN